MTLVVNWAEKGAACAGLAAAAWRCVLPGAATRVAGRRFPRSRSCAGVPSRRPHRYLVDQEPHALAALENELSGDAEANRQGAAIYRGVVMTVAAAPAVPEGQEVVERALGPRNGGTILLDRGDLGPMAARDDGATGVANGIESAARVRRVNEAGLDAEHGRGHLGRLVLVVLGLLRLALASASGEVLVKPLHRVDWC